MSITMLIGHTSPETAFVQDDYPYGRTLRCQRRCWIEYKPKQGYRPVTQTNDPKRPGLVWNKPHAGTYSALAVMYLDESSGHVEWASLNAYASLAQVDGFATRYGEALQGAREASLLAGLRKIALLEHERGEVQARMRELPRPLVPPTRVLIERGGRYVSQHYAFWVLLPEHAFVFPSVEDAAALIAAYPVALKDATGLVLAS